MQITKRIALCFGVALILASVAAASASASQRSFEAGKYPASISGQSEEAVEISTSGGFGSCEAALNGGLTSTSPILAVGVSGKCKNGFVGGPINMNGCKFELNSDYSTLSIGPAGCGPISLNIGTGLCLTYIPAQNGIPVTYSATTKFGQPAVRLSVNTNQLKYRECSPSGELKENGSLRGTWDLVAFTLEGIQTSLSLTKASYINLVSAEKYPAGLVGSSTTGAKFTTKAGTVNCAKVTYAGTQTSVWEYVEVVPTFSECTVFGFANGTVNANGCKFSVSAFLGWEEISCPEGKAVTISAPSGIGCAAEIPSQAGFSGGTVTNTTGKNGRSALDVSWNISGLTLTTTNDSFFACGFEGVGSKSSGSFTDKALIEGQDSAGPIAIKVGA